MKKIKIIILFFWIGTGFIFAPFLFAESDSSEAKPSPELLSLGKGLFTNTKARLGAKYACILCHQGQKAISRSKVIKLGPRLPDVINDHLVKKSKGKAIAKDSQEMKALEAYILHEHSV